MTLALAIFATAAALGLWTWYVTRNFPWWTDSTEGSNTD